MTLWELLRAMLRWWPIVLAGAVCTAVFALWSWSDKGVYYTRTQIVFLAPTSSTYPNALQTQSEDIVDTAGVVAKLVGGPGKVTKYASPDVTIVGTGVRDGWSLRLPDTGGQWATNFVSQTLDLEVVSPDREVVRARQERLIRAVSSELFAMQRAKGVAPVNDIIATAAPQSTVIYHVGGSRPRAYGMIALLGIGATVSVVILLERLRPRSGGDRVARRAAAARSPELVSLAE